MRKFVRALTYVSGALLMVSGVLGLIYELLIFDKSVIPHTVFDVFWVLSFVNLFVFLICVVIEKKKGW